MFNSKGALLSVLATAAIFSGKADANNIGIAFSGGGFKSVADQVRFTLFATIDTHFMSWNLTCLSHFL